MKQGTKLRLEYDPSFVKNTHINDKDNETWAHVYV